MRLHPIPHNTTSPPDGAHPIPGARSEHEIPLRHRQFFRRFAGQKLAVGADNSSAYVVDTTSIAIAVSLAIVVGLLLFSD